MSALAEMVEAVGDDSPAEHKALFILATSIDDALKNLQSSHNRRYAERHLRQGLLRASAILKQARDADEVANSSAGAAPEGG